MRPATSLRFPSMTSRSSEVSFPHCFWILPFRTCQLPLSWSVFIGTSCLVMVVFQPLHQKVQLTTLVPGTAAHLSQVLQATIAISRSMPLLYSLGRSLCRRQPNNPTERHQQVLVNCRQL